MENNRICSVIITYNPKINLLHKNIKLIDHQVEKIFLIDNNSENKGELSQFSSDKIKLIYNNQNLGIATALNLGFICAEKENYDFVLTLDQDSLCDDNLIAKLSNYIVPNTGIVCPAIQFNYSKEYTFYTKSNIPFINACITSGSLTSVYAWRKIGGFDEWMFIDHVDNDFCLRLKINGFYIIRNNDVFLNQQAGNMKLKKLFGINIRLFYYSNIRCYYITRNTLYFIKKHKFKCNFFKELLILLSFQLKTFVFETNRSSNLLAFTKGFFDAMIKKVNI